MLCVVIFLSSLPDMKPQTKTNNNRTLSGCRKEVEQTRGIPLDVAAIGYLIDTSDVCSSDLHDTTDL
jgi:hypothetical protein